jgi:serine/threonine-protein kinase TTK/MPS1
MSTPRDCEALLARLAAARGDVALILQLISVAERDFCNDLQSLCDVYGVAVDTCGHGRGADSQAFRDLCVKRLRALCRVNPAEAREFHNYLRTLSVGRFDARLYEARAAMEERLGDVAKAIKILQEAARVCAQPEDGIRKALHRLQPEMSISDKSISESGPRGMEPVAAVAMGLHQLEPIATATSADVASALPPSSRSALPPSLPPRPPVQIATSATQASTAAAVVRPRILGLGCPMRRLDGDGTIDDDDADNSDGESGSGETGVGTNAEVEAEASETKAEPEAEAWAGDDAEALGGNSDDADASIRGSSDEKPRSLALAGTFQSRSRVFLAPPLSPIQEINSPASVRASCCGATPLRATPRPWRSSVASVGDGLQATPQTPVVVQSAQPAAALAISATPTRPPSDFFITPRKNHSRDSSAFLEPPPSSDVARKVIHVNGVPYLQLQTIGRGGSSKVYQVQDPGGEVFALKRVNTDNPKQLEALQEEVALLRQLHDHERVVQLIDAEVDEERGRIHIVMEQGEMDLGRYLHSEANLSLAQLQSLWQQMLEAVDVIHNERIVHSDLKPPNFVLVKGRLKVIDFGIAKRINNDTTNISRDANVGTLSYMAPEALKQGAHKINRASDVWSLGVILYLMVYERTPFQHLEQIQKLHALSDPNTTIQFPVDHRFSQHSDKTKADIKDVLTGCLQRDPRKRLSIPELLNHSFLRKSEMVSREALGRALSAVMVGVGQSFCSALGSAPVEPPAEDEWNVLLDEVWGNICGADANKAASPPSEAALAPLWRHLQRCTSRPAADSAVTHREQRRTTGAALRPNGAANVANATTAAKNAQGGEALVARSSGRVPGGCSAVLSTSGKENARSTLLDHEVQPPLRNPQRSSEPPYVQVPSAGKFEEQLRRDLWR